MNKEEYIRDKENKSINIHAAWEMYMDAESNIPKIPLTEFMQWFPQWAKSSKLEKYWEYYDKKFEL